MNQKELDNIRKNPDKVKWGCVSSMPGLSEDFIREFSHKVNWANISIYQTLSEEFIDRLIALKPPTLVGGYRALSKVVSLPSANFSFGKRSNIFKLSL
jgi:hypothetical protein